MNRPKVVILGATGSIGKSTLAVIAENAERYDIFALTANQNIALLYSQCLQFQPRYAVVVDPKAGADLREKLASTQSKTEVLIGRQALVDVAADAEADIVVAAIVGAAGLLPTLAAVTQGKRVLLANKEALVMSGDLFMQAAQDSNATLLPVDSEHNALLQCMPSGFQTGQSKLHGIDAVTLTASGGPFRLQSRSELTQVTPEQAIAHPNWTMGSKISIDSATMMNKGLEVIEAHWLFGLPADQIKVLIHPQSIVHSLVHYADGSTLAQMGYPDMRTPIACALSWPERIQSGVPSLDLAAHGSLEFLPADLARWPCLRLATQALRAGGSATCILNAANEVAIEAFMTGQIEFLDIAQVAERVLNELPNVPLTQLETVFEVDKQARQIAKKCSKSLMIA